MLWKWWGGVGASMNGGLTVIKSEVVPWFFAVFAIFGHAPGELISAEFCTDVRGFWSVRLLFILNKTQQLKCII